MKKTSIIYIVLTLFYLNTNAQSIEGGNLNSTINTIQWNDFVGHTSGWTASDVTEYSAEVVVTDAHTLNNVQSFELNSTAKTDMQNNSEFEFIPFETEEWIANNHNPHSTSTSATWQRFFSSYRVDAPNTSLRPFIEFETGAASGYTHKVLGVAAGSIGKVKNVATANIGKVIGVD